MKAKMTDLQRLSLDVYKNKNVMFNEVSGEDALRNMLSEAVGGEFNFKSFRANMYKVFSIIEEAVDVTLGTVITNQFDSLADVRNIGLGDQVSFKVEDPSLFRVARIAGGTNDLRRQKLINRRFSVDTDKYGIAIYEELDMFVAGRIDWSSMINRVGASFANFMGTKIYQAISDSYSALLAPYTANGAYDEDKLFTLIQHVEAKSGKKASVYGTKQALRSVGLTMTSSTGHFAGHQATLDQMAKVGYVETVAGTDMYLLPQAHVAGTDNFAVNDKMLLILPQGSEKIVKVVLEGEALMLETAQAGQRNDQQLEYQIQKTFGVGVLQTSIYGMYIFN